MRRLAAVLLPSVLLACAHRPAPPAAASPAAARLAWDLEGQGRLLVEIPPGWTASAGEPDPPLPASLRLEPPAGRQVLVLTPTWEAGAPADEAASAAAARQLVELARRSAAEAALEPSLGLVELGGGALGWYFAATDREFGPGGRAPGPDEYRCLVQGTAVVGALLVPFTLLDDGDGPHRGVALDVVRHLRLQPAGAGEPP